MGYRCPNPDCAYPEAGKCVRGFDTPETECEDLRPVLHGIGVKAAPSTPPPPLDETQSPKSTPVPQDLGYEGNFWSGYALGGDEAGSFLWDPRTLLFTVVGGKDRGKTCLLTAFYIQLANGFTADFPYRFCGSRSLEGFRRLSDSAFAWQGGEERILPRTTNSSFRQPSFLHLALKRDNPATHLYGPAQHVLLTDMPGEWFESWVDHGSEGLPERLDFLQRSDGILLTLDTPRLLRDRTYRKDSIYLFDRIVEFQKQNPRVRRAVAVVLTKYDRVVSALGFPKTDRKQPEQWGALAPTITKLLASHHPISEVPFDIFPCAAFSRPSQVPVGALAPFRFLLECTMARAPIEPIAVPVNAEGRFFGMFREGDGR